MEQLREPDTLSLLQRKCAKSGGEWVKRTLSDESQRETGFIAQDVWHDAPELRHIISLPIDTTPAEEKPTGGDDPQEDPDYDGTGWGTHGAGIQYSQLTPVLVKSNQELHERIADLETAVASRDKQIDEIRSELSDIVSRLGAVESG